VKYEILCLVNLEGRIAERFRRWTPSTLAIHLAPRDSFEFGGCAERNYSAIVFEFEPTIAKSRELLASLRMHAPGMPVATVSDASVPDSSPVERPPDWVAHLRHPVDLVLLESLLLEQLARGETPSGTCGELIGSSRLMRDVIAKVKRVAPTDVTVLLSGETGTGKDLAARAIHVLSPRASGRFVAVNCASLADTLLESELFGHERGSFTGASARRIGRFEEANGGTIFLDEIGDTSPHFQARLLRVLQEKSVQRVGGNETIHVDARVIAATHRDLGVMRRAGSFRDDLYYRLSVVELHMPPLRARRDDIATLVRHFVTKIGIELGIRDVALAPSALEALCDHEWPGNVRELEHGLKRAILLGNHAALTAADILGSAGMAGAAGLLGDSAEGSLEILARQALREDPGHVLRRFHDHADRALFDEVLKVTGNNLSRASWLLGVSRPTLRARLAQLGLRAADSQRIDDEDTA
jgi:transcriptional regulator with GAF, ATPase, and Fis domain